MVLLAGMAVEIAAVEVAAAAVLPGTREGAVDVSNQVVDAVVVVEIVQIGVAVHRWRMVAEAVGIDLEAGHRRSSEAAVPSSWVFLAIGTMELA